MSLYFEKMNMAFDNVGYWMFILVIASILVALLIANVLIQTIKPLKKALIPAPVLGGFLLLIFLTIYKKITGTELYNTEVLEMITYHLLGIGFIATALKKKEKGDDEFKKKNSTGIFDSSLVTVSGYLIQALVGLAVSVGLFFILKEQVWPASGVLVPMGFGQGPGQALNWGKTYEEYTIATSGFGSFVDGKSFGLAVAAMGFIAASVGGIIYLNVERKKGNIKFTSRSEEVMEKNTLETYEASNEIPTSGTIDKFTVQLALVILVYLISFGLIMLCSRLCDNSGVKFLINTVKPLLWGFNFIIGTGIAALVKMLMEKFEGAGAIKKRYINNYQLDRIGGFSFDIMVVAAISSINLDAFAKPEFIVPLLAMGVLATIVSYNYIKHICKHLFEKHGYYEESFLCLFGMLTGTASTGVILLREIDPEFKTPACNNMVFQTLYSIVLGAPVLLLMGTVGSGWNGLITSVIIFAVYFVFINILIYRDKIFKKKKTK